MRQVQKEETKFKKEAKRGSKQEEKWKRHKENGEVKEEKKNNKI